MTYIWPCSDEKTFEENWKFHVERFTPIAAILGEHGIALGLEFLGPKTLRDEKQFPFVHTMAQMLELGAAIGPNVGLLLDCWHWYTSGATLEDLRNLRAEQVVYVHLNDAPRGIERDAQIDLVRDLPAATGVIDLAGFLQALQSIGYDGPLVVEPFCKALAELPTDAHRLAAVRDSLSTAFEVAGLEEKKV
jgi:sugar phosphate isomerase/epimerase